MKERTEVIRKGLQKYSSILICVPTGSLSLINPEKIKSAPTKIAARTGQRIFAL